GILMLRFCPTCGVFLLVFHRSLVHKLPPCTYSNSNRTHSPPIPSSKRRNTVPSFPCPSSRHAFYSAPRCPVNRHDFPACCACHRGCSRRFSFHRTRSGSSLPLS